MMTCDSRLHMSSYILKLHIITKAHTLACGRPSLKDVDLKIKKNNMKKKYRNKTQSIYMEAKVLPQSHIHISSSSNFDLVLFL